MNFIEAMKVAEGVFEQYRLHQLKWWRRMDGTPILNDIAVRMAVAFSEASTPSPAAPTADLSWNGFRLFGDVKSIDEAKRLLHEDGQLAEFRGMVQRGEMVYAPPAQTAPAAVEDER